MRSRFQILDDLFSQGTHVKKYLFFSGRTIMVWVVTGHSGSYFWVHFFFDKKRFFLLLCSGALTPHPSPYWRPDHKKPLCLCLPLLFYLSPSISPFLSLLAPMRPIRVSCHQQTIFKIFTSAIFVFSLRIPSLSREAAFFFFFLKAVLLRPYQPPLEL